jgi:hypothetical protein
MALRDTVTTSSVIVVTYLKEGPSCGADKRWLRLQLLFRTTLATVVTYLKGLPVVQRSDDCCSSSYFLQQLQLL